MSLGAQRSGVSERDMSKYSSTVVYLLTVLRVLHHEPVLSLVGLQNLLDRPSPPTSTSTATLAAATTTTGPAAADASTHAHSHVESVFGSAPRS